MPKDPTKDDRLFAPFPIEMDEHPKIIGLSDAAFRAIFEATFYSRRMLSDGFLDERVVLKRWGLTVAEELSCNDPEKPSWIRVDAPKPGWRIHDFEKHHPLRAEIQAKRADVSEKRSEAGRNGAAKRWQAHGKAIANDSSETETESQTETTSPTEKGGTRKRGHRIPEPFLVTGDMRAWAAGEVPTVDVDASTRVFVDYWRAEAGAKATKLDWVATWKNWLRRDAKSLTGTPHRQQSKAAQNAARYKELFDGSEGSIPALDSGVGA